MPVHEPMKTLGFWRGQKGSGDTEFPFYNIKRGKNEAGREQGRPPTSGEQGKTTVGNSRILPRPRRQGEGSVRWATPERWPTACGAPFTYFFYKIMDVNGSARPVLLPLHRHPEKP